MSQVFVPGPAHIYTAPNLGTTLTWSYLGQTEGDLAVSEEAMFEPVFTDTTGPRIAFDEQYLGKECFVQGTLVKYNEAVWQALANRLNTGTFGTVNATEIGTLMRTELKSFSVCVVCPYQSKAAYSSMPAGFYFHTGWLFNQWDATLSTMRKRQRFVLRFIPDWTLASGVTTGILFETTMPALPAIT